MTPEGKLWHWLKSQLDKLKTNEVHYDRIENIYGTGTPDVSICYLGTNIWIELKVKPNPLSKNQKGWHRRYRRALGHRLWTATLDQGTKTIRWENKHTYFVTAKKTFDIHATLEELIK